MKDKLYYERSGSGETALLFLHYFGGSSGTWSAVIELLKEKFDCIAIDLPGFGNSAPLDGKPTVENIAMKVMELLSTFSLKNYVLVGHSMGGKIAAALAAKQLQGLHRMILIAPSPPTPEPMDGAARKKLLKAFGNKKALEELAQSLAATPLSPKQLAAVVDDNLRCHKTAWDGWLQTGSKEDISNVVKNCNVPVTVVSGSADPNFSTGFLRSEFSKVFPAATYVEIKNTGHLIPVEAPQKLAGTISAIAY